jgi:methionine-gamma-lyase
VYPGLESHPDHSRFKQLSQVEGLGFGGMVSVNAKDPRTALKLATRLQQEKFGLYAVSLGFSRTLMTAPALSTSSEIPEHEQRAMGLEPGLLRLSIGYTGQHAVMFDRFLKCWKETISV